MSRFLIFIIFFSFNSFSQEIESDLLINSLLEKNKYSSLNKSESVLSVPFIDDFSYNSSVPDTILWKDNSVFINKNYGVNPITIGVNLHLMD